MHWADLVVFVNIENERQALAKPELKPYFQNKRFITLNVPDNYEYRCVPLQAAIRAEFERVGITEVLQSL